MLLGLHSHPWPNISSLITTYYPHLPKLNATLSTYMPLKGSLTCNHTFWKTCSIYSLTLSVTSPNTKQSYPITNFADCKSSTFNLVYQLQCNAFYIGETGQMLLKNMNGHRSTCTIVKSDLLVPHLSLPAPFSGILVCPRHTQTPWCHPRPCLLSIWNCIPTYT